MTFRRSLACTVFVLLIAGAMPAGASAFDEGRILYEAGKHAEAAAVLGKEGEAVSPGLLHNLGNAELKSGHVGRAILAWERARSLDPGIRNSVANLHFARGQAGLEEPRTTWYETYASFWSADTWIWLATLAFWAAVALLALPSLLRYRRNVWIQAGAVVAIVVVLLTTPALAGLVARSRVGVIVAPETDLRLTPTAEAEVLGGLAEGELARVEKVRGAYVYVRASGDRAGWVRQAEFAKIWP